MTFPKYESYKDSGVEWLGEIPQHWSVKKLKFCCANNTRTLREDTDPQVQIRYIDIGSVSQGKIEKVEHHSFKDAPSRARRLAKEGDTIVSTVRTYLKAISYIKQEYADCVFSTGFCVLSPNSFFDNRFFSYLLQSEEFINEVVRNSKGVSFPAITPLELSNFSIAIPIHNEQKRIANFLDRKTSEIDQAIAQKQRLIELLQEQKAILINQAVTKGLDPNVPMCDSGVEWIGEIPGHWKLVQNRRFLSKLGQGSSPAIVNSGEDEGFYVLKISAVKQGIYIDGEIKTIPRKMFVSDYQVKKGDFLMTRGNTPDLVADICYVNIDITENIMISDLIYRLTYNQKFLLHEFIAYFFRSSTARYQIKICARGSSHTMVKVSQEHIKAWLILVPPLNEQREIISYLKCIENEFFCLENQIYKEIEKLNELKTIFISQAVTGKIKN